MELKRWLEHQGAAAAFEALAELVPDAAVVVADDRQRVIYWSRAAERLLGWKGGEIVGTPCPDGVLCEPGRVARPWGAQAVIQRADGGRVEVRHFSAQTRAGSIHLLQHAPGAAGPGDALPRADDAVTFHGLTTRDPGMLAVFQTIRNVAETDATVLVRGESGTGKELVAHAIHAESHRRNGPFVAVNCAAFTPTLLESELFGHVRGAFTGAEHDRAGIFAQADDGTLFLDEVAELPLDLQAKLLRVLQERSFVPVGGTRPVEVDVRVVAATHRSLREEVARGRFREDLMYRLRVVPLFLPPLRDRRGDVDVLVAHQIAELNARGPRHVGRVEGLALAALRTWPWPGNVRELRNALEHAFAVGRGDVLRVDELPPEIAAGPAAAAPIVARAPAPPSPARRPAELDADTVRSALEAAGGHPAEAARRLGIGRTTLWRLRRQLGV